QRLAAGADGAVPRTHRPDDPDRRRAREPQPGPDLLPQRLPQGDDRDRLEAAALRIGDRAGDRALDRRPSPRPRAHPRLSSPPPMPTVLVTGSAGLIGAETVRHFGRLGHRVVGIDNNMRSYFFGEGASTEWSRRQLEQGVN